MSWKTQLAAIFVAVATLLFFSGFSFAQNLAEDYAKKTQEIRALEQKLIEISQQKTTLANQIVNFNTQIRLTELRIEATELDIASLSGTITRLEIAIIDLSLAYEERVAASYRLTRLGNTFLFLFTSQAIPRFLSRIH